MNTLLTKLLAVLLSVVIAGAGHACLCGGMVSAAQQTKLQQRSSHAAHACCKPEQTKTPAQPASHERCADCNLRNAPTASAPEKSFSLPLPDLFLAALSLADFAHVDSLFTQPAYRVMDDVPVPPLLQDLHHCACLLTV